MGLHMANHLGALRGCMRLWLVFWISAVMGDDYPEQGLVGDMLAGEKPTGVVFLIMEYDEEALEWVVPRVTHYVKQLRAQWPEFTIVILSHGDEMFALQSQFDKLYAPIHEGIKQLVNDYGVVFQVCGSHAYHSDIDVSAFPSYVDVVPFAPAEIENYRHLEYHMINLELTW
jgi:intracellular sulfur oxidation DsrE/DsrF family protein